MAGFALFFLAAAVDSWRTVPAPAAADNRNATTAPLQLPTGLFLPLGPLLLAPLAFSDLLERVLRLSRPTPLVTAAPPNGQRTLSLFSGALFVAAALTNRMAALASWLVALLLLGAAGVAPADLTRELLAALLQESGFQRTDGLVFRATQALVTLLLGACCFMALGSLLMTPFLCAPIVRAAVESRRFGRMAEPTSGEPILRQLLADASRSTATGQAENCVRPRCRSYFQSNDVLSE